MSLDGITPEQWKTMARGGNTDAGKKFDGGKPMWDLVPVEAVRGIAEVLTYGAGKYEAHNWRKGIKASRLIAATLRHLASYQQGVDYDDESGLHHVDHALSNLAFLSTFIKEGRVELDDRYKPTK